MWGASRKIPIKSDLQNRVQSVTWRVGFCASFLLIYVTFFEGFSEIYDTEQKSISFIFLSLHLAFLLFLEFTLSSLIRTLLLISYDVIINLHKSEKLHFAISLYKGGDCVSRMPKSQVYRKIEIPHFFVAGAKK